MLHEESSRKKINYDTNKEYNKIGNAACGAFGYFIPVQAANEAPFNT
jgi:hypothetical protein